MLFHLQQKLNISEVGYEARWEGVGWIELGEN